MRRALLKGMLAGAAGTTALNAATYLDMALRARPASTTPEETVHRAEEITHRTLRAKNADEQSAENRRSGIGALLGIVTGVGSGALYGLVRECLPRAPFVVLSLGAGAAANVGSVLPMIALGVTDPRTWPASSWVMDAIPHLAYGAATVATYELTRPGKR